MSCPNEHRTRLHTKALRRQFLVSEMTANVSLGREGFSIMAIVSRGDTEQR